MQGKHINLLEVFSTKHGAVYQCNNKNVFFLEFAGKSSTFKVSDFIDFIKRVNNVDLNEMAKNTSRTADLAILMPHYTERCFILTIEDTLNLREILNGAKFTIHLNSMLRECLFSLV